MNVLDTEIGAKGRAVLVALAGLITAVITFLQEVVEIGDKLPDWGPTGAVLAMVVAAITFLGRFTKLGNSAPVEGGGE